MGCGIEPRKEEFCRGRDARNRRRQHVRHRYARCRRSAGAEGHITSERNASEPERSHVWPQAAEPTGPHREGEEPKPMMHGHEKSDSAIVATKPPNKAGSPAAEAVERRAEAKESTNRCHTCRTQGRESVSHGAGARTEGREASRQTSEVGAVCGKAARTVLCGGRSVMGFPTAIVLGVPLPAAAGDAILSILFKRSFPGGGLDDAACDGPRSSAGRGDVGWYGLRQNGHADLSHPGGRRRA